MNQTRHCSFAGGGEMTVFNHMVKQACLLGRVAAPQQCGSIPFLCYVSQFSECVLAVLGQICAKIHANS